VAQEHESFIVWEQLLLQLDRVHLSACPHNITIVYAYFIKCSRHACIDCVSWM